MFRKYYKAANDDIKTNRELIEDIFEKANDEKRVRVYKFPKKFGTIVAAVLILGVFLIAEKDIRKIDETPQITRSFEDATVEIGENEKLQAKVLPANNESTENPEVYNYTTDKNEEEQPFSAIESRISEDNSLPIAPQPEQFEVSFDEIAEITNEETLDVTNFLISKLGEIDEATGNRFIFEILGKISHNEQAFYAGRWRWLLPDGHSSMLSSFVLADNMQEMYEFILIDNKITWTKENNLIK